CLVCRPSRSTLFPYTTLFRSLFLSLLYMMDSAFLSYSPHFTTYLTTYDLHICAILGLAARIDNCASRRRGLLSSTQSLCAFLFRDRKSTRLNSSHVKISYAVF